VLTGLTPHDDHDDVLKELGCRWTPGPAKAAMPRCASSTTRLVKP
jgi:hypothetical protein